MRTARGIRHYFSSSRLALTLHYKEAQNLVIKMGAKAQAKLIAQVPDKGLNSVSHRPTCSLKKKFLTWLPVAA